MIGIVAIMGNEINNRPSPLVKNAKDLILQKDKIEFEINELESALRIVSNSAIQCCILTRHSFFVNSRVCSKV